MSPDAAKHLAERLTGLDEEATILPAGLAGLCALCPQWQNTGLLDVDASRATVTLLAHHGPVDGLFEGLPARWPLGISPARPVSRSGETRFIADIRAEASAPLYRVDAEIQGYRSVALLMLRVPNQRDRIVSCHARDMQTLETAGLEWLELGVAMMALALAGVRREPAAPNPDPPDTKLDELIALGRADLAETARQFALYEGRYQRTSDALGIHVSTLRYRLERLRETFGVDLADPNTRLNLRAVRR